MDETRSQSQFYFRSGNGIGTSLRSFSYLDFQKFFLKFQVKKKETDRELLEINKVVGQRCSRNTGHSFLSNNDNRISSARGDSVFLFLK